MPAVEQIICWFFGLFYLRLAFDLAKIKDGLAYSFVVLLVSAFSFFCGLSGVQAFLKTHMLTQVLSSLESYGEKIEKYETAVAEMHRDSSQEQLLLKSNQIVLSLQITNMIKEYGERENALNQKQVVFSNLLQKQQIGLNLAFQKILDAQLAMQSNAAAVQSDILAQESKLTNIEVLVDAIYSKTEYEDISSADTNKVLVLKSAGKVIVAIRLNNVPIRNTVQGIMITHEGQRPLLPSYGIVKNVLITEFPPYFDIDGRFVFTYAKDNRINSLVKEVNRVDDVTIGIDGISYH